MRDLDLHSWLKSHDLEPSCEAPQPKTGFEEKWPALMSHSDEVCFKHSGHNADSQAAEAIVSYRVLQCPTPRELSFDEVTRPQSDSV